MQHKLKSISKSGITEALDKVAHYRALNQAEEAESICRDILVVEPEHQMAKRLLALSITDQFTGTPKDRFPEALVIFSSLQSEYERLYYNGILHERRAKAELAQGHMPHTLYVLFEEAMKSYEAAEKVRPAGNDDAILRWNRCVRILQGMPDDSWEKEDVAEFGDSTPVPDR